MGKGPALWDLSQRELALVAGTKYWNLFLKMLSTMSGYRHLLHREDRYVMLDL